MRNKVTIEQYNEGDEVEINNLFNSIFDQKRDIEEWSWKFKESPVDARPFIVLAKDEDKIVGQYACIVYYLKYQDKTVMIAQPVDNMVHKDYRGGVKGVLFELYSKAEEGWRDNEIGLVFGFPNREAYIVGKKFLKYIDLIKIENLFKRLSWRLALKKRVNVPFWVNFAGWISRFIIRFFVAIAEKPIKGVQYRWVDTLDERVDSLWKMVREQYCIMVERDFKYLNWRYCKKPGKDYHILKAERDGIIIGIIIVKYEDHEDARIGFIMECISIKEPHLMENLVKRGLIFLSQNKVDYVLARLSPHDPIKNVFYKQGFLNKEGIWHSNFVHIHPKKYLSNVDSAIIREPSLWHISFGDTDSL